MSDAGGIKALRVRVRAEGGDCLPGGGGSFFLPTPCTSVKAARVHTPYFNWKRLRHATALLLSSAHVGDHRQMNIARAS